MAAYVRPGSALDREALERGNSVYFPDRVVPMLPERISNDLCSLRPREARPALAVRMVVGPDGRKKRHSFHRITMRSAAKLAYAQAQAAIDGRPDDATGPLLDPVLKPLWAAYACVKAARDRREPLALDLPERKILLKPDGTVDRVLVPERLDAHRLIEEFMILANVAAAETLEKARSVLIYRVHDEPSLEKMRALGEVLASIGIKLPKQGALRPALFNGVLRAVEGTEHQLFINEVVLRSQAQAEYAAENYGHFGLNLRRYAHFTSPIRRYADLVVHRALIRAMKLGDDGLPAERHRGAAGRDRRPHLGGRAPRHGRGAGDGGPADRPSPRRPDRRDLRRADLGRHPRRAVRQARTRPAPTASCRPSTIGADYYRFEEGRHALVGERTGETYRLGDRVEVKLVEAAPVAGALRFELLSEGRPGRRAAARRGPDPAAGAAAAARRGAAGQAQGPGSPRGEGGRMDAAGRVIAGSDGGRAGLLAPRRRPRFRGPLPGLRARPAVRGLPQGARRLRDLRAGAAPSPGGRSSALHRDLRRRPPRRHRHPPDRGRVRPAPVAAP